MDDEREMAECTFSPRLQRDTAAARALDRNMRSRSGKNFQEAQNQFVAKKNSNLEMARREQERQAKKLQKKEFMSKKSKRILDRSERSASLLGASRNTGYPSYRDRSQKSLMTDVGDVSVNQVSNYLKDLSGTKMSFLNSSSMQFLDKNHAVGKDGQRLFSPKINRKSRMMSPRDSDTTFYMLHQ